MSTMPFENGGINGLLSNPALQMGLGILASNNSNNLGQVIGRGGLMGLRNLQQQQLMAQRQQQTDLIAKRLEAQTKEIERKAKQAEKQKQAGDKFKEEFPQYASVYDISPAQAMKLAYPQASSNADPYFSPVYDSQRGLGAFNARTGETTWQGGAPIIKPSDDPRLQGDLSYSKQFGKARATPTDMEDGVIQTEAQLINKLGAPQSANPWQIPPEVQAQRDKEARAIIAAEQGQGNLGVTPPMPYSLPTGGIKVPTKAEQAAATEAAKLDVKDKDANKGRIDSLDAVTEAKKLLEDGIYTGALASMKLKASKLNPFDDPRKAANTEAFIAAIGNTVVPRLQEFGGNDSVEEMNYLKAIMGGNIELEPEALKMVLDSSERKIIRGMKRAGIDVDAMKQEVRLEQGANSQTFSELPPANKYKGQIIRDAETGKRYKSNGMQWKEL